MILAWVALTKRTCMSTGIWRWGFRHGVLQWLWIFDYTIKGGEHGRSCWAITCSGNRRRGWNKSTYSYYGQWCSQSTQHGSLCISMGRWQENAFRTQVKIWQEEQQDPCEAVGVNNQQQENVSVGPFLCMWHIQTLISQWPLCAITNLALQVLTPYLT